MQRLLLILAALFFSTAVHAGIPRIIAHRGVHTDAPENSLASLRASRELGVWGSEFDIWLTTDGVCVINHNPSFPGHDALLKESSLEELSTIRLTNGESLPTLGAYLALAASQPGMTLVCELKRHGSESRDHELFDTAWAQVCLLGMQERVVFQTFSYELCRYAAGRGATVFYLCSKEKSVKSANELKEDKIAGGNYSAALWLSHPSLVREFHEKGLQCIVTAQDRPEMQRQMLELGVDVIATNRPAELKILLQEYDK